MEQRQHAQPTILLAKRPDPPGLTRRCHELRLRQHRTPGMAVHGCRVKHDDAQLGCVLPGHCGESRRAHTDQAATVRRAHLGQGNARHALRPCRLPQGCAIRVHHGQRWRGVPGLLRHLGRRQAQVERNEHGAQPSHSAQQNQDLRAVAGHQQDAVTPAHTLGRQRGRLRDDRLMQGAMRIGVTFENHCRTVAVRQGVVGEQGRQRGEVGCHASAS